MINNEAIIKLLKTPIICNKRSTAIKEENGVIISPQRYYAKADPDMSDLTIEFYKVLYGKEMLEGKHIIDKNFAGDTIHSFNSIALWMTKKTAKERKNIPISEWPDKLQTYYYAYPCLANFWAIPSAHGRTSKKLNYYDDIDIYIDELINKKYLDINMLSEFESKHCITKGNSQEILSLYTNNNYEAVIDRYISAIDERAQRLAKEKSQELIELFSNFKLLNN